MTPDSLDWDAFKEYLESQYRGRTARERLSYSRQFADCLLEGNFSKLKTLSDDKRGHVMKALSALAKFLGIYQEFKMLVQSYGLKWTGRSKDDIVIDRLTKVKDPGEVFKWIRQVKTRRPELSVFMDFMAISGLRLEESVESYDLIIKLSLDGKLSKYYNAETETLEHYKFKETFIRKTKKAFISFVPESIIECIVENVPIASANSVLKLCQRSKLKLRFGDIREAHGTFMTKYLKDSEIDFLHGRVSTNVFMSNYFNPALIADLKQRVFQGIKELQEKV